MDAQYCKDLGIALSEINPPFSLILADGKTNPECSIKYRTIPVQLKIGDHYELLSFFVGNLGHPVILGFDWLSRHNPDINWPLASLTFQSAFCLSNCCSSKVEISEVDSLSLQVQGTSSAYQGNSSTSPNYVCPSSNVSLLSSVTPPFHVFPPSLVPPSSVLPPSPVTLSSHFPPPSLNFLPFNVSPVSTNSIQSDVYPYLEVTKESESTPIPPGILKEFSELFSKGKADKLPPHREYDCTIDTIPGSQPAHFKHYRLTVEEDQVLQNYIDENYKKGFIRKSSSPYGSPCFFVKKKDKSLRLCVDYRGLNKITLKNRNPIPLISEMIRTLAKGKIFTTLDFRGAYNLLRVKDGHEHKTAFVTKYGQWEYLVMPFGLTNAPPQFQFMMNDLFRNKIGKYVLIYLDDIVIYSEDLDSHKRHVREVLQTLKDNGLYCKPEKCRFYQEMITYLGYVISQHGIAMDPEKIESVLEWPAPSNIRELQVILGFCNFYRNLIPYYATLTAPFTVLLKKDSCFKCTMDLNSLFLVLKNSFVYASVLSHPDETKP